MAITPKKKHTKEPPRDTFNHALWSILGKEVFALKEVAFNLKLSYNNLHNAIRGYYPITVEWVAEHNLRELLNKHYPVAFSEHLDEFNLQFSRLPHRAPRSERHKKRAVAPDTLGGVIWHILGGQRADHRLAAERLSISNSYLNAIVHGHKHISAQTIEKLQWKKIFAQHYSEQWEKHKDAFETLLPLQEKTWADKPAAMGTDLGFEDILHKIIGPNGINYAKTSGLFGMSPTTFEGLLKKKREPSLRILLDTPWKEAFLKNYPETWQTYRKAFQIQLARKIKAASLRARIPEDPEKLEHLLWKILGSHHINYTSASDILNISKNTLKDFIKGKGSTSLETLQNTPWKEALSRRFPEEWNADGDAFLRALEKRMQLLSLAIPEPRRRNGLEHVLWRIVGGRQSNQDIVCADLGITQTELRQIMSGRGAQRKTKTLIRNGIFQRVLSEKHSQAWQKLQEAFIRHANELTAPSPKPRRATTNVIRIVSRKTDVPQSRMIQPIRSRTRRARFSVSSI